MSVYKVTVIKVLIKQSPHEKLEESVPFHVQFSRCFNRTFLLAYYWHIVEGLRL
jgi:hypothetical protein